MKSTPTPSLRRMPRYLRCLSELTNTDSDWVSCTWIAERLTMDPTLVRKDLSMTGITGRPKVGYRLNELVQAIERFIGWDNPEDAFLVGAGDLGSALLGFAGFAQHGLNIVAGFDVDTNKIGKKIHGKMIFSVDKLADLAQRMHIGIGIIAVNAPAAQAIADLLVAGGIRAIWNFAPVSLEVPKNIIVENEDLSATLAVLSRRISTHHKNS